MTLSYLQYGDGGTSRIATGVASGNIFASNPGIGNSVLACINVDSTGVAVTGITSTWGGDWCKIGSAVNNNGQEIWLCNSVSAAGKTVTVTTTAGGTYRIFCYEFPPVACGNFTSTTVSTSLTVTPTAAGDFMVVFPWMTTLTADPTGSWTNLHSGGWTDANGYVSAYQVAPNTTGIIASITGTGTYKVIVGCAVTLAPYVQCAATPAGSRAADGVSTQVFLNNTTLGNSIIAILNVATEPSSVSGFGATWTKVGTNSATGTGEGANIWLGTNVTSASKNLTVTGGGSWRAFCFEYPGLIVASDFQYVASSTSITVTPAHTGDFVVYAPYDTGFITVEPATPWKNLHSNGWQDSNGYVTSWVVAPSTSSIFSTVTSGHLVYGAVSCSFSPAVHGGFAGTFSSTSVIALLVAGSFAGTYTETSHINLNVAGAGAYLYSAVGAVGLGVAGAGAYTYTAAGAVSLRAAGAGAYTYTAAGAVSLDISGAFAGVYTSLTSGITYGVAGAGAYVYTATGVMVFGVSGEGAYTYTGAGSIVFIVIGEFDGAYTSSTSGVTYGVSGAGAYTYTTTTSALTFLITGAGAYTYTSPAANVVITITGVVVFAYQFTGAGAIGLPSAGVMYVFTGVGTIYSVSMSGAAAYIYTGTGSVALGMSGAAVYTYTGRGVVTFGASGTFTGSYTVHTRVAFQVSSVAAYIYTAHGTVAFAMRGVFNGVYGVSGVVGIRTRGAFVGSYKVHALPPTVLRGVGVYTYTGTLAYLIEATAAAGVFIGTYKHTGRVGIQVSGTFIGSYTVVSRSVSVLSGVGVYTYTGTGSVDYTARGAGVYVFVGSGRRHVPGVTVAGAAVYTYTSRGLVVCTGVGTFIATYVGTGIPSYVYVVISIAVTRVTSRLATWMMTTSRYATGRRMASRSATTTATTSRQVNDTMLENKEVTHTMKDTR